MNTLDFVDIKKSFLCNFDSEIVVTYQKHQQAISYVFSFYRNALCIDNPTQQK